MLHFLLSCIPDLYDNARLLTLLSVFLLGNVYLRLCNGVFMGFLVTAMSLLIFILRERSRR